MNVTFCLIRNGLTSTAVVLSIEKLDVIRRFVASVSRNSGAEFNRYHFIGFSDYLDISGTDRLEELTGTITGSVYDIINKREINHSYLEFDLEPHASRA